MTPNLYEGEKKTKSNNAGLSSLIPNLLVLITQ